MENIIEDIKQEYRQSGYHAFAVNRFETFQYYFTHQKVINHGKILKVLAPDGEMYALQADITMSAAKMYSRQKRRWHENQKIFYDGPTYSSEKAPNIGITTQRILGVEWFGGEDMYSDVEVLTLAFASLAKWQRNFVISLSISPLLDESVAQLAVSAKQKYELQQAMEMKNIVLVEQILAPLLQASHEQYAQAMLVYVLGTSDGSYYDVMDQLIAVQANDLIPKTMTYLRELSEYLEVAGILEYIQLDFSLKNQQSYYKGLMFKGYVEGLYYPVLQGGRSCLFETAFELPFTSIGFSIRIDEFSQNQQEVLQKTDVLLIYEQASPKLYQVIRQKQQQGLSVEAIRANTVLARQDPALLEKYSQVIEVDHAGVAKEDVL